MIYQNKIMNRILHTLYILILNTYKLLKDNTKINILKIIKL